LLLPGALLLLAGCTDSDVFIPLDVGAPAGVVTGTVTYAGPPPCTAAGRVVGAAILLGFEERALPPPDGLGTSAVALTVVTGETLFSGVRDTLSFDPGGALVCPPEGAPKVTVSATFAVSPLAAGTYQIRGFYDYDANFHPVFSIFNLPTLGDVGGGAIENTEEVLLGAPPRYRSIPIGEVMPDGTRAMPAEGDLVEGVSVTLGLRLPLDRPRYHLADVIDEHYENDDPEAVVVPADYQLAVFSQSDPFGTEASFIRLVARAGFPESERQAAAGSPFFFPVGSTAEPPFFFFTRQDVNRDGLRDDQDTIPEGVVPALAPMALLSLREDDLHARVPVVLMQAITLRDNLISTVFTAPDLAVPGPEAILALRPAAICLDPRLPDQEGVLVLTHPTDGAGNPLIADPTPVVAALSAQFGRPMRVEIGCLPQGRYAVNILYETGQAWTIPNEAGVCGEGELPSADGAICGTRPRLASQSVAVTVGEPTDPGYCEANPPPSECQPTP
jgi:hypothetical protein